MKKLADTIRRSDRSFARGLTVIRILQHAIFIDCFSKKQLICLHINWRECVAERSDFGWLFSIPRGTLYWRVPHGQRLTRFDAESVTGGEGGVFRVISNTRGRPFVIDDNIISYFSRDYGFPELQADGDGKNRVLFEFRNNLRFSLEMCTPEKTLFVCSFVAFGRSRNSHYRRHQLRAFQRVYEARSTIVRTRVPCQVTAAEMTF